MNETMDDTAPNAQRFNWERVAVSAIVLFALLFSLRGLTSYPAFWFDEALNIQAGRNLSEYGFLNLEVAPGVPYEKPYHLTTGYPVIAPLAALFSMVGFDFARLYMIGWLLLFLYSAYLLARAHFGPTMALLSLLLLATFAPVYGNGETVIAEVPAMALFFLGLFSLKKASYRPPFIFLAGLLLGLAAAIKPIYFLIAPALLLSAILKRNELSFRSEWLLWVGFLLPVLLYVFTIIPPSDALEESGSILSFWQSRTAQGHLLENISANVIRMFKESSLLYTLLLSILVSCTIPWRKIMKGEVSRSLLILGTYGMLILLFFLQSIGWNRYLLFFQAIVLLSVPPSLLRLRLHFPALSSFFSERARQLLLCSLIVMQTVHLFFFATIFKGTGADDFSSLLSKAPFGSIYVVNSAEGAAFVPPSRLYHYFDFFESNPPMENRLSNLERERFAHLLFDLDDKNVLPYLSTIERLYERVGEAQGVTLFSLKVAQNL